MSFGLRKGRSLDVEGVGFAGRELPPLPDDVLTNPQGAWLDPREWFDDPDQSFELEIGSGKGTFLVQQAQLQPDVNFLGIEWAKEFYEYAADRIRRHRLNNVRLLNADATEFVHWRVPTASVSVLHLYFSDPWPKKKHHKRRVVQDSFLADVWRILTAKGELRIVTDHSDYWQWMEEHFARWTSPEAWSLLPKEIADAAAAAANGDGPYLRTEFARPESAGEGEVVGTNFERKYRREGRPFHSVILRKNQTVGP